MATTTNKLDAQSAPSIRSPGTSLLQLQCANRNYLASLVVVREEHAPRLPTYQRRVPIPLDNMDATGTHLPQKSAFRNDGRQVMIRCPAEAAPSMLGGGGAQGAERSTSTTFGRESSLGGRSNKICDLDVLHTWQPHHLYAAPQSNPQNIKKKKMQRCTFGVPTVKPRESPARDSSHERSSSPTACLECSKSNCACHDEIYGSFGNLVKLRSLSGSPSAMHASDQHASQTGRTKATLSKFLEPLRNVKSHNLFQKLLALPSKDERAHRSSTFEGSPNKELPTAADTAADDRRQESQPPPTDRNGSAGSVESTVISFSSANRPPPSKFTLSMKREAVMKSSDLNHSNRIHSELEAFENREVLRKEREEYLKSSNSLSLAAMRKARKS